MSDYFNILIVGAGQLGSRYLQGLVKSSKLLRIYVVDTNSKSLLIAEQRWLDVLAQNSSSNIVTYYNSLEDCPKDIDIAIVSTTAFKRAILIGYIQENFIVKYWILEKVLTQSVVELDMILHVLSSTTLAWINTPRRMYSLHNEIRDNLIKDRPLHLNVYGKEWGLACNSIHFLDMFAWFTGESLVKISTEKLGHKWIHAKRSGYWEILGEINAIYSNGSTISLFAEERKLNNISCNMVLEDGGFQWEIDEDAGSAVRSDGLSIYGKLPLQSEVTSILVDQIIDTGNCNLPLLIESEHIHRVFIEAMLKHWQLNVESSASYVPIT